MAKQELGWWMVGAGTEWYDQSGGGESRAGMVRHKITTHKFA